MLISFFIITNKEQTVLISYCKKQEQQDHQESSCVEFGGGTEPLPLIKWSVDRFGF